MNIPFVCSLAICGCPFAYAQLTSFSSISPDIHRCEVWGRVVAAPTALQLGLTIELVSADKSTRQTAETTDGAFEFRAVPAGEYAFRISDHDGRLLLQWPRILKGSNDHVVFHLPVDEERPKWADTVPVGELTHKIPKEALKAFRDGIRAFATGDAEGGVSHLKQAVDRDPQFAEAQITLSGELMMRGDFNGGLLHARLGYDVNPTAMRSAHMFAAALIEAKQFREAEKVVRGVIDGQPYFSAYNPEFNALMAISLIGQRQYTKEAFEQVELAAKTYPSSRLLVANALVEVGQVARAVSQVREYIRTAASPCERADLEAWIAKTRTPAERLALLP